MAAGNFDPELTINPNGGVDAKGPLSLTNNEVMEALYVWIFQPPTPHKPLEPPIGYGPAAISIDSQIDAEAFSDSRERWSTNPQRTIDGTFTEGPATAMALAVSRVADGSPRAEQERRVFWWADPVKLVFPQGKAGP